MEAATVLHVKYADARLCRPEPEAHTAIIVPIVSAACIWISSRETGRLAAEASWIRWASGSEKTGSGRSYTDAADADISVPIGSRRMTIR